MNLKIGIFLIFLVMKFLPILSLTWATPVIENDSNDFIMIADEEGNIIEISQKKEDMINVIQAQTYHQATNAWSSHIELSNLSMNAHHPKIATDPYGNAVALWQITDGIHECIQASFYNSSTNQWSSAQSLTPFEKNLSISYLAMNEQGTAFAAWKQGNKNISKTATFSRNSNVWKTLESPNLPVTSPRDVRFFLDISNNTILINKTKEVRKQ